MSGAKKYIGLLGVITLLAVMFQPTAKAQSLQEFLQSAYDNHPTLPATAQNFYRQFEGRRAGAIEGVLPTLQYSYSSSYARALSAGGASAGGARRSKSDSITLSQNLFKSFRDVYEFRGFLNFAEALEFQYYNSEQDFLQQLIEVYLNVIRAKNIVGVRLANYESLEARLDIVQRLYDIGDATELDLQQSRAQLLSAQTQWEQALAEYEGTVANFRRYAAIEPIDLALADIPAHMPTSKEDGEQQALKGNFELRAAELTAKASKLAYRAIQASAGLRVDLGVNYSDSRAFAGPRGGAFTRSATSGSSITTSITARIDLYDPTISPSIRNAYQTYLQAKNGHKSQRLSTISTFQSRWATFTRNAKAEEFQRQAVEAAQIALDNVVLQQRAGLRSIVEVLDEETRLINAQVQYEEARYRHLSFAYQVLQTTGQLTAKDLGLQTTYGEQVAKYFEKHDGFWEAPGGYTAIKGLFVEEE